MTDEQFESKLEDLTEMIRCLRRITDRGNKRWLRAEIRALTIELTKD